MTTFIVRRLLIGILILVLVTVLVFIVMRLLPGDPLMLYVSQSDVSVASPEQLKELRHEFGLDKSLPMQYIDWIGGALHGDLGESVLNRQSVSYLFSKRLPITLYLGFLAFIISSILGVAFGTICAIRRGKKIDTVITVLANIGITVPSFWVGILLIYLFSLKLGWLPTSGYVSPLRTSWTVSQNDHAGLLPVPLPDSLSNPADPLERAGGGGPGLCPDRLGQGPERARYHHQAYH